MRLAHTQLRHIEPSTEFSQPDLILPHAAHRCYVTAFVAAMNPAVQGEVWPGVAGVFQVACILASGLLFFVSRTPADGSYSGYEVF
jgi:hypothetical protein